MPTGSVVHLIFWGETCLTLQGTPGSRKRRQMCWVRLGNTGELQHEPIWFPKRVNALVKAWACTINQAKLFMPTVRTTGPSWWWVLQFLHWYPSTSVGFCGQGHDHCIKKKKNNIWTPKHLTHFFSHLQQWPALAPQRNPRWQWHRCLLRDSHQPGTQRLSLQRKEKRNLKTSVGKVNPSPISARASRALAQFPARAGSCEWNEHLADPSRGFWQPLGLHQEWTTRITWRRDRRNTAMLELLLSSGCICHVQIANWYIPCCWGALQKTKGGIKTVLILLTFSDLFLDLAYRFSCYHTFQSSLRLQGQMELNIWHMSVHITTMRIFQDFISIIVIPFDTGNLFFSLIYSLRT